MQLLNQLSGGFRADIGLGVCGIWKTWGKPVAHRRGGLGSALKYLKRKLDNQQLTLKSKVMEEEREDKVRACGPLMLTVLWHDVFPSWISKQASCQL